MTGDTPPPPCLASERLRTRSLHAEINQQSSVTGNHPSVTENDSDANIILADLDRGSALKRSREMSPLDTNQTKRQKKTVKEPAFRQFKECDLSGGNPMSPDTSSSTLHSKSASNSQSFLLSGIEAKRGLGFATSCQPLEATPSCDTPLAPASNNKMPTNMVAILKGKLVALKREQHKNTNQQHAAIAYDPPALPRTIISLPARPQSVPSKRAAKYTNSHIGQHPYQISNFNSHVDCFPHVRSSPSGQSTSAQTASGPMNVVSASEAHTAKASHHQVGNPRFSASDTRSMNTSMSAPFSRPPFAPIGNSSHVIKRHANRVPPGFIIAPEGPLPLRMTPSNPMPPKEGKVNTVSVAAQGPDEDAYLASFEKEITPRHVETRRGKTCSIEKGKTEPVKKAAMAGPHRERPFSEFILDAERMTAWDVECLTKLRKYSTMASKHERKAVGFGMLRAGPETDALAIPFRCFSSLHHYSGSFGKKGNFVKQKRGYTKLLFGNDIVLEISQNKESFELRRRNDALVHKNMYRLFGANHDKIPAAFFIAVIFEIALTELTSPIARTVLEVDHTPYLINNTNFACVWETMDKYCSTIDTARYRSSLDLSHIFEFNKFHAAFHYPSASTKPIYRRLDAFKASISQNIHLTALTLNAESRDLQEILPTFETCVSLITIHITTTGKYKARNMAQVQCVTLQKLFAAVDKWSRDTVKRPDPNVSYAYPTLIMPACVRTIERVMVPNPPKPKPLWLVSLLQEFLVPTQPIPGVAVAATSSDTPHATQGNLADTVPAFGSVSVPMKEADDAITVTLQPTKLASCKTSEYLKRIGNVNTAFALITNRALDHYYNFRLPPFTCEVPQPLKADGTQPPSVTVKLIHEYLTADLDLSRSNVNEPKRLVQGRATSILGLSHLWEGCLQYVTKSDCENVIRARMGTFSDVAVAMVLARTASPGKEKPYSDWVCSKYPALTPALVALLTKWRDDIQQQSIPETRAKQQLWCACYVQDGAVPVSLPKALRAAGFKRPWQEAAALYEPFLSGRNEWLKL
ncbi:hypothetical protein BC830DRAFT_1136045 [Chytriomyces sp. MP71]|nr:hypothetical protein BC830DRAFT_1136045 [Chytriomyces sp. MP71]